MSGRQRRRRCAGRLLFILPLTAIDTCFVIWSATVTCTTHERRDWRVLRGFGRGQSHGGAHAPLRATMGPALCFCSRSWTRCAPSRSTASSSSSRSTSGLRARWSAPTHCRLNRSGSEEAAARGKARPGGADGEGRGTGVSIAGDCRIALDQSRAVAQASCVFVDDLVRARARVRACISSVTCICIVNMHASVPCTTACVHALHLWPTLVRRPPACSSPSSSSSSSCCRLHRSPSLPSTDSPAPS